MLDCTCCAEPSTARLMHSSEDDSLGAGSQRAISSRPCWIAIRTQVTHTLIILSARAMTTARVGTVRRSCGGQDPQQEDTQPRDHGTEASFLASWVPV